MTTATNASTAPFRKRTIPSPVEALKREAEATKMLLAHLKALEADDDAEVVHDAIEGETNLFEALAYAVRRTGEDEATVEALKAYENQIKDRRQRLEKRIDAVYAAIGVAMDTAGEKRFDTPFGTIGVRPGNSKVNITEESDIPAKFWVPQDPKLDKTAVKKALQENEDVPGAHLSNGESVVSIRRR